MAKRWFVVGFVSGKVARFAEHDSLFLLPSPTGNELSKVKAHELTPGAIVLGAGKVDWVGAVEHE